ncbi:hypothetical protein M0R45_038148 [Rubus argutus]|uniref:Uncharacterized protein n=1 Tax=Rubus argutus TaxID=59490 RepID=A0AAW1W6E4_RUBAR
MENSSKTMDSEEHVSLQIPSLIEYISSNEVVGFDNIAEDHMLLNDKHQPSAKEIEVAASESTFEEYEPPIHQRVHSVSISMPSSPMEVHLEKIKRVLFSPETILNNGIPDSSSAATKSANSSKLPEAKFHSQPLPKSSAFEDQAIHTGRFPNDPSLKRLRDNRYDNFKTWSGKLERQITLLRGKTPRKSDQPENTFEQSTDQVVDPLPADRYFDALEGPELDTLRSSEEIVLPEDKQWPFLLRYPISSFSICLGISSQAILWKTLPTSASTKFLHLSLTTNLVLWCRLLLLH